MCGIFGIIAHSQSGLSTQTLFNATQKLFQLSETRGKDASGALINNPDQIDVIKTPQRVGQLIKSQTYLDLMQSHQLTYQSAQQPYCVLGHTRMVTNGSEYADDNNQPVITDPDMCLLHNGIIVNDEKLWLKNPDLSRQYQVDTEVFGALIQRRAQTYANWQQGIHSAFNEIQGANSFAIFHNSGKRLFLCTNNGSLYWAHDAITGFLLFASEALIVDRALRDLNQSHLKVQNLTPNDFLDIDLTTVTSLHGQMLHLRDANQSRNDQWLASALKKVVIHSIAAKQAPALLHANERSQIAQLLEEGYKQIPTLLRCTMCLLPATIPFIKFDKDGICQMCLHHKPLRLLPHSQFNSLVEHAKTQSTKANCLVPISGGRDSCYGLHYIKKELGLNPVAYTYDWGFVTDLARRNTSRMCGALGVEHVLVAADIRQKRENVRKNVLAWLNKPSLGMIPLFMAGDKMFFHYASLLRRQMNLGPIIFSMNWLEQTGFKAGFAGVDSFKNMDDSTSGKTHGLPIADLARLVGYYGGQFLSNPKYLNSTLPDTVFAFFAYYLKTKDYFSLFDYLPWTEEHIASTIIDQYDWEIAADTKSTWRIGDGTAPFYNYIYHRVAGFSEHDTFRSNQIREGMITREVALAAIEEENQPRVESFKWYCDVLGLDAIETIKKINAIPQRYAQR